MSWTTVILGTVFGIVLSCFILMPIRINRVHEHRIQLINIICEMNIEEIRRGTPYNGWRYNEFKTVPYYKQLLMFWKSYDSFYTDKRFFEEIQLRFITKSEPDTKWVS